MLNVEQLKEKVAPFEGTHKIFAEELVIPNLNKCEGNRAGMVTGHLPQSITLNNSEPPEVFTRFENSIGEYSNAYMVADEDMEVLKRIKKNEFIEYVFVKRLDTKVIDLIELRKYNRTVEKYAYQSIYHSEDFIEGSTIEKDQLLYRSTAYDEDLNFGFGVNLKCLFLAFDNLTEEDAIVASHRARKKLEGTMSEEIDITFNTNDVPLNLFGDKKEYKSFARIGEDITDGRLIGRRRITNHKLLFDGKDESLKTVNPDEDTVIYVLPDSIMVDINVYANLDKDEEAKMRKMECYKQLFEEYDKNMEFYTEFVTALETINDDPSNEEYDFSDDVMYLYTRYGHFVEKTPVRYDNTAFNGFVVSFQTASIMELVKGSKITARHGNKGTISAILDDEDLVISEDGEVPDLILNPFGVPNRMNFSQLYELRITMMNYTLLQRFKEMNLNKREEVYFEYLKLISPIQYNEISKIYKNFTKKQKDKFFNDMIESNKIFIHQPPFYNNANFDTLVELYNKYKFEPKYFYYKGQKIETPLEMGSMYFMRLRHDPRGKTSVRSAGDVSLSKIPSRTDKFHDHKIPYSDTPIRFGEMELNNLLLTGNMESVMEFINSYAANEGYRQCLSRALLTENILDLYHVPKVVSAKYTRSIPSQVTRASLTALSVEIIND